MKYADFENIMSAKRMGRYLTACGGDTRKAMTLYRYNLQLSQVMFTIVSCFEVALRNSIDRKLTENLGNEWVRDSIMTGGVFSLPILRKTSDIIAFAYRKLQQSRSYSHTKLLAEMEFGIWKYMFSPIQYRVTGRNLLSIFPNKPRSSREKQYNQTFIFNELDKVNSLRNRIAHHENICFATNTSVIDTTYVINIYSKIKTLFLWMDIDSDSLLYGLDHISRICAQINKLKNGV
ncbi:MAG: Abi family protein [Muribaculaceae bacterium]|nr:Abi family protein [Muribaculaceae bacterium]